MLIQGDSDFHFGAHAVDMGDEDGLLIAFELVKAAEEADSAQDLGAEGRLGHFSEDFFDPQGGIDIDSG